MSVEKAETGHVTHNTLRSFDAALEDCDKIGMVVSDADSVKASATLPKEGAVEEAKRIARDHDFSIEVREADEYYPRRAFFEYDPEDLDF